MTEMSFFNVLERHSKVLRFTRCSKFFTRTRLVYFKWSCTVGPSPKKILEYLQSRLMATLSPIFSILANSKHKISEGSQIQKGISDCSQGQRVEPRYRKPFSVDFAEGLEIVIARY